MASESLFSKCSKCGRTVLKSEKKCPDCNSSVNTMGAKHWLIAAIFAFIVYQLVVPKNEKAIQIQTQPAHSPDISNEIRKKLKLEYSWQKQDIVSVMIADLTVTNESAYDVKDIEITCKHFSKSGTNIDSNSRSIFEIFPAGASRSFEGFNMGFIHDQTYQTGCTIDRFKIVQ